MIGILHFKVDIRYLLTHSDSKFWREELSKTFRFMKKKTQHNYPLSLLLALDHWLSKENSRDIRSWIFVLLVTAFYQLLKMMSSILIVHFRMLWNKNFHNGNSFLIITNILPWLGYLQVHIGYNQTKIENTPYIRCYSQYLDFPVIEESLLRNDIYTVVIQ